jgi:AcrR family transcriptional regulator
MTTAKHLPADERRALTVDTVITLAAEQNPSEITTAAIAARMQLTQGALFRHFPTKDAIWQAVMEWVSDRLLASTRAAADAAATPLEALEAMFAAHVEFIARHPGVPRMMFGELQRASETPAKRLARTLIARYAEHVAAIIEAGRECGQIRTDTDAAAAATLLIGTVQGLAMQAMLADDITTLRKQAPGAFAIYRRGIASAA